MRVNVTKTYKGCIELRDYDAKKCIEKKEPIEVFYDGDKMTLTPLQLSDDVVMKSKLMKSKVGGKDYHLLGYEWNPDPVEL